MGSFIVRGVLTVVLFLLLATPFQFASSDHGGGGGESALASTPTEAARELYHNNRINDVRRIFPASFTNAFGSLHLYEVREPVRHPPILHRMAWNPATDTGYDFTKEFHSLLTVTTAVIATSSDAIKYAKAFAESANVEIEPLRQIVTSANSTMLNHTVADPSASLNGTAWKVTLSTWAEAQGVFANWTTQFAVNQIQFGKWRVQGTGVGPWYFDLHGENSYVGVLVHNAWNAGTHSRGLYNDSANPRTVLHDWYHFNQTALTAAPANFTNYDDSWWKVYYPTSYPWQNGDPVVMDGYGLAKGGISAFENETWRSNNSAPSAATCYNKSNSKNYNLRFESRDSNCELKIVLHHELQHNQPYLNLVNVASADESQEIVVLAPGFYKAQLHALGRYLDPTLHTNESIARTLVAHELSHALQFTFNGLSPHWGNWFEGQSTVIAALANPAAENHTTSLLAKAFNGYLDFDQLGSGIDRGLCHGPVYDATLFWAVLYSKNGGMKAFHQTMKNMTALAGGGGKDDDASCALWMPKAITGALAHLKNLHPSNAHSDFNHTHRDMAIAGYARNISFAAPNGTARQYGQIMIPLVPRNHNVGTTTTYTVPALGAAYVRIVGDGAFNVTVSGPDNSRWRPLLMQRCADASVLSTEFTAGVRTAFTSRSCVGAEDMLAIMHPYRDRETATVVIEA